MTSAELAEKLGVRESYIRGHWQEIVVRYERIGIHMVKLGRGKDAKYGLKMYGDKELKF